MSAGNDLNINININDSESNDSKKNRIKKQISGVAGTGKQTTASTFRQKMKSRIREKMSNINYTKAAVGTAGTIAGTYTAISAHMASTASMNGADYKAARLNKNAERVGTAVSLGVAWVVNPVAGAAATAAMAYKISMENRQRIRDAKLDSIRSMYYTDRLVKNITWRR